MPRFVVLEHTRDSGSHFDLMLEEGGALLTWSFEGFPATGMSCRCLFDHRLRYLDYEGDIGGGRGTVKRVDSGTFDMLARMDDCLYITLRGERLRGNHRLTKSTGDDWTFEAESS
ncbi:MAG TPA: DNA polymerase ligase N-terminal domain-containing protein [Planctomycetota bacterium]|nr:DNA polymerase ligase N-terminal domain-containing protein [Planctomycetota bacterium]HUV39835.1 DNA polymerase ligase N-terminal domain-containing protein [Planctomycetota bacterium]